MQVDDEELEMLVNKGKLITLRSFRVLKKVHKITYNGKIVGCLKVKEVKGVKRNIKDVIKKYPFLKQKAEKLERKESIFLIFAELLAFKRGFTTRYGLKK